MFRDLTETLTFPVWALLAKLHSEEKTEAVCSECAQDRHYDCTDEAIDSDDAIGPCMCRHQVHLK